MNETGDADGLNAEMPSTGGLLGWGILLIVVGGCVALVALVMSAVDFAAIGTTVSVVSRAHRATIPTKAPSVNEFIGLAIALAAGAGSVWVGIDTIRRRRWVRPVILVGAPFVMAYGILDVVAVLMLLSLALTRYSNAAMHDQRFAVALPAVITGLILHVLTALSLAVVLPCFLWRYFHRPETAAVLAAIDSRPAGLERCPMLVLAWVVLCVMLGVGLLLRLMNPALPVFTFILSGRMATVCLLVIGILLLWGAWLCYRLDRLGLILTAVLVTAIHSSVVTFLWRGGSSAELDGVRAARTEAPREYWRRSNAVEHQTAGLPDSVVLATTSLEALMVLGLELAVARDFVLGWRVEMIPGSIWDPQDWRMIRQ